jgi:hypothetical protein
MHPNVMMGKPVFGVPAQSNIFWKRLATGETVDQISQPYPQPRLGGLFMVR